MPDAQIKADIGKYLENVGFDVVALPESAEGKSPDLVASKHGERFAIEIKSKLDDPSEQRRVASALERGESAFSSEWWGPKGTVAKRIAEGVRQAEALPREHRDFTLVWLHADGSDEESQFEQFAFTLYGLSDLYSLMDASFRRTCYYFHESSFFTLRESLDGAIRSTSSKQQLCLNTYSPRYGALRKSSLSESMAPGVLDPLVEEMRGRAAVADFPIDRADSDAVKHALQEKYGVDGIDHIHMGRYTINVAATTKEPK